MKISLLDVLCCPGCHGFPLHLETASIDDEGGVMEGRLSCPRCRESYAIVEGIPDMRPPKNKEALAFSGTDPKSAYQSEAVAQSYNLQRFSGLKGRMTDYLEKKAFRKALAHCPKEGLFLDVPCGTGRFTRVLAREGYNVIGADISLAMLRQAHLGSTDMGYVGFICCDAEHLPFKDNALSNLSSMRFLNHLNQSTRLNVLREFNRVIAHFILAGYFNRCTFQGVRRYIQGFSKKQFDNCLHMQPKSETMSLNLHLDRNWSILPIFSGTNVVLISCHKMEKRLPIWGRLPIRKMCSVTSVLKDGKIRKALSEPHKVLPYMIKLLNRFHVARRRVYGFDHYLSALKINLKPEGRLVGEQKRVAFYKSSVNSQLAEMIWNLTPGYEKILQAGFSGLKKEALNRLKESRNSGKNSVFLRLMARSCDTAIMFANRHVKEAEAHLVEYKATDEKTYYKKVAELCGRVPAYPARTFLEALQALYFTQMLLWGYGERYLGLGRLDQYLYPYYKKDLLEGRIGIRDAEELLTEFWERINDEIHHRSNNILGDSGQSLILGGVTRDGRDGTNDLSYLCLDVTMKVGKSNPNVLVRVHSGSPDGFLKKACELARTGMGFPTFVNDDVVIPALLSVGYSLSDARDYSVGGCWEPLIPGRSFDRPNSGKVIFLKCLEAAINNGKSLIDSTTIGLPKGFLSDSSTFQMLMENLKAQIQHSIEMVVKSANKRRFVPSPILSLLIDDCLEKGIDVSEGGARYNNAGILGASFADTVDSLAAIKKLVFEDRIISAHELHEALKNDFKGEENLRQVLLNKAPKFGNDDDYVDMIGKELAEFFFNQVIGHKTQLGGLFKPSLGSENGYVETSGHIGASANGRHSKDVYGSNFSSALGMDKLGPTALVKSCTKIDLLRASNGAVTDIKFHPITIAGDDGLNGLVAFVKGVVELGGSELQLNVVSRDTLIDAQVHPEKYQNLIVRVWGFSAHFVSLPKEYQDHIIARTEH